MLERVRSARKQTHGGEGLPTRYRYSVGAGSRRRERHAFESRTPPDTDPEYLQRHAVRLIALPAFRAVLLARGGSNSIKNLWPQSTKTFPWNSYVKDALERRLHNLVCAGKLDLRTAQQLSDPLVRPEST
jgi:hypothetical protein